MTLRQYQWGTEYVRVGPMNFGAIDPTGDAVQFAFIAEGTNPQAADWQTASWEAGGPPYFARCLVGPAGTVSLLVGDYIIWVKISDSPETPIHPVDALVVFGEPGSLTGSLTG
jgi:hypothetical protein